MRPIAYVTGDATQPPSDGSTRIVAHVVNDLGRWGAGFSGAVSRLSSKPEQAYRKIFESLPKPALGRVQFVRLAPDLLIANMIAQRGLRSASNPVPLRYDALATCLDRVMEISVELGASVHMSRIGAGLAGGDWDQIEKLIERRLCAHGVPVTVYNFVKEERANAS